MRPSRDSLILETYFPQQRSTPPRTSRERRRAESSRSSSPGYRARPLVIVSSDQAGINIYDKLAKTRIGKSRKVVARNGTSDLFLSLTVYRCNRKRRAQIPSRGSLILDTACPR